MIVRKASFLTALLVVSLLGVAADRASAGMSVEREVKIGREVAEQLEKEFPVCDSPEMQAKIDEIGQRLVAVCPRQDIQYHFKIIRMGDDLNAFALPGGYIYITEPFWKMLGKDERAAILGHELAHVSQRHFVKRVSKETKKGVFMILASVILQPNAAIMQAGSFASDMVSMRYSRADEKEADALGLQYMTKAGYEPWAFVSALQKMLDFSGDFSRTLKFLSTHPLLRDRITVASDTITEMGIEKPVYEAKSDVTLVTAVPDGDSLDLSYGAFSVTGNYGGSGAESGFPAVVEREFAATGQTAGEGAQGVPYKVEGTLDLSLDQTDGCDVARAQVKLSLIDPASREVAKTAEASVELSGDAGETPSEPWVGVLGYTKSLEGSLVGAAVVQATRRAILELVPYPQLVEQPVLKEVRFDGATVVLDGGWDVTSPGAEYAIYRPLGDWIADEETGELLYQEPVTIATVRTTLVGGTISYGEIQFADGFGLADLSDGEVLSPLPDEM
jgi:Zn-dependent protease with chaperone function